MATFQYRRGTAAAWTAANPVLSLGEPGLETDTLKMKVGDGMTAWTSLPYINEWGGAGSGGGGITSVTDGTNTVASPTELLVSGGTVSNPSTGIAEITVTGGGSGSTAVQTFTNVSTAQTLASFVNYPLQIVQLTGNPTITIPAGPAGQECAGCIEFVQDSTGGRTWGYAGSVAQPSGAQIPGAGPNGFDLTFLQWDGSQWIVLPATSGPTLISALGVLIEGAASGLGYLRLTGSQATGAAPGYTPSSSNLELVADSGLSGGFGFWYSPVGSTTWHSFVGGSGGGGSLPTGTSLQGLAFNRSATVIAENRQLVDIASETWTGYVGSPSTAYSVGPGVTDNGPGLMAAAYTLSQSGRIGYLNPGTYPFQTGLVFGNGSSSSQSTWSPYLRGGGVPPVNSNSNNLTSTLKWTGGTGMSSPLVVMQGPFQGCEFSNMTIDGNSSYSGNSPALGLQLVSVQSGVFDFLNVWNVKSGIQHTTVGVKTVGGIGANCSINSLRRVNVQIYGAASPTVCYGVQLTNGTLGGGNGNTCYEVYEDLSISQITGTGASGRLTYGLYFQCADSCRVHTLHISNGGLTAQIAYDYTNYNVWPAGCVIDGQVELGGATAAIYEIGSPAIGANGTGASATRNIIMVPPSTVNGTTPDPQITAGVSANTSLGTSGTLPLVKGTTWGSPYLHGQVTLSSGTKNITCPYATTGYPVELFPVTLSGTPGVFVIGTVSANGTITVNSYQSDGTTIQTGDASTYYWRLLK